MNRTLAIATLLTLSTSSCGLGTLGGPHLTLVPAEKGQLLVGMEFDVRVFAQREGVDLPCADQLLSTCTTGESYDFEITSVTFGDPGVGEVLEITQPQPNYLVGEFRVRAIGVGRTTLWVKGKVLRDGVSEEENATLDFDVSEITRAPFYARCSGSQILLTGSLGPRGEDLPTFAETVMLSEPRGSLYMNHLPFGPNGESLPVDGFRPTSEPPELLDYEAELQPGPFVIRSPYDSQTIEGDVVGPEAITEWRYVALTSQTPRPDPRILNYSVPQTEFPLTQWKAVPDPARTTFRPMPFAGDRIVCGGYEALPDDNEPTVTVLTPDTCTLPEFAISMIYDTVAIEHVAAGLCAMEINFLDTTQRVEFDIFDNPRPENP